MKYDIEFIKVNDLHPYEKNAKKHPQEQIEYIKNSIKEFGFRQNLVVDKDNVVIIGHGRLEAAKQLGLEYVPCIKAEDLTEEQIKALRLADNKVAESEWDLDLLNDELDDIFDIDMSDFGFDLNIDFDSEPIDVEEDEVPETVEPIAKPGDLWQLGNHKLICGDSTDVAVIDRLMDGAKADMVFTDPPYGMNLDTDYSKMDNESSNAEFRKRKNIVGGKKYEQGKVDEFHPEMIDAVFTIDADEMFLWGADYFAELLPNKNDGSWIVWDKRDDNEQFDKMYGSQFELCWSKKKHKREIARVRWCGVFGTETEFDHKRYHPTQKPIKLSEWFLKRYSKENQVIVDIFGGSGSTLIACEQLNRKCYMCELDPHYCDVILQRYINLKGSDADVFLLKDGEKIPYNEL
jgi:DNA modification methylase